MTIKQAAMWLCQPGIVSMIHDPTTKEALSVAVKALAESEHGTNLASLGTDCISRQAAIDAVMECYDNDELFEVYEWKLNELPAIQPKRGKWIEDKGQQTLMQIFIAKGEVWRVCSVCGAGHMIGHKYECDKAYHETYHNFCPNCGCRMDGGE
jgi:hypothetical protein